MTSAQEKVVDWCNDRVKEKCGYIMGATGQTCSLAFRQQQAKQYASYDGNPSYGQEIIMGVGSKWDGRKVYDCQGFTRRAYELLGLSLRSGATTQYNEAKKSYYIVGSINEMPPSGIPGTQLWRKSKTNASVMSHTAICIGNGKCVEAQGTASGIIQSSNILSYTYYGVPAGLLTDIAQPPIDGPVPSEDGPSIGNEKAIGRTVKGGVNMRKTPGGTYVMKIPEYTDIEIIEYADISNKRFGKTIFAAPSGKYIGNFYIGWVDLSFIEIYSEGKSIQ